MTTHNPELAKVLAMLTAVPFDANQSVVEKRLAIDALADAFAPPHGVEFDSVLLGGVAAERQVARSGGPVVLYFHGGGYLIGSPRSHRHMTALLAQEIGGTVFSLDYRMAPEAPFPAAVEDAVKAWTDLAAREGAARVAFAGDSAGGGLTFAALVSARDKGLPLPACAIGISPWVNLGTENASYTALAAHDPMLSGTVADYFSVPYRDGVEVRHPLVSPLFANLSGLPPVLIQIGDREVFFGDACAMHQALIAADVDTELAVWKEMFHVWHLYWPMLAQGRAAVEQIAAFVRSRCG
ncbi:alpha/beta hydrolase [Zavarzinia sp. CC-PAN008]|uniref:alpha/beta hydrolase n=1 Tax=Zavarzinia sp. CC-PAN008 TaxID=3243332 RepID=UPI003F743ED0